MPPNASNPASAAAPTGFWILDCGEASDPTITRLESVLQVPSPAVAAALMRAEQRQRDYLLDIKRGSLWTVAAVARDHLDSVLWSLEQPQFDQVFPCAEAFVEHARAVAKLANDFENERRAIAGQTGAAR